MFHHSSCGWSWMNEDESKTFCWMNHGEPGQDIGSSTFSQANSELNLQLSQDTDKIVSKFLHAGILDSIFKVRSAWVLARKDNVNEHGSWRKIVLECWWAWLTQLKLHYFLKFSQIATSERFKVLLQSLLNIRIRIFWKVGIYLIKQFPKNI